MQTILHLLSSNKLAGAENVAIGIISNLGNLYKAYYLCPDGPISEILNQKQISYVPVEKMTPSAVQKVVNQLKPDIIHAHDYRASIIGAIIKGNVRLISHLHNNYVWARKYNARTLIYSSLIDRMDNIVVVSNSVLEEHVCYNKMYAKTTVLPNCIDLQKIYNNQSIKKDRSIDLIFVGRLTEQKDPVTFITCVCNLLNKGIKVNAGIVGEGDLLNACVQEIRRLGLNSVINIYGFQSNPYKFIADSRVLLMPSRWEGFGLVAMEAMSLGVPVVCTGVGGLKEIVSNGHDGFICNNIDEIVNAVGKLLTDNECWHQMSKNALETASKRNDMKSYIAKIEALYR